MEFPIREYNCYYDCYYESYGKYFIGSGYGRVTEAAGVIRQICIELAVNGLARSVTG